MKYISVLATALLYCVSAQAQPSFHATVRDGKSNAILSGAAASIQGSTLGAVSDTFGVIRINGIPAGRQVIIFKYLGYQSLLDTLNFPLSDTSIRTILLHESAEDDEGQLDAVIVSTTRSSRTIANTPTRIEVISGEELEEKGDMKPGDIRMLLAESTGIQTQQTSATSGNSSIRIQGLDGKYTQVIRDGFPLYSGFSGGLSLLQITPLDLKQVEVVKGSSSTLYGGGAIAGLVNLISKTPTDEGELNFLANGTSALGADLSGFYSQKFAKIGVTVYGTYNHGSPYDPSGIGLSAIPRYNRYTINPKLFLYLNSRTMVSIGANASWEDRIGGDMQYLRGHGDSQHSYFELNNTRRYSSQFEVTHRLPRGGQLSFKNSLGYFDRSIILPDYHFSGVQISTYTEANYSFSGKSTNWIAGFNYVTDRFNEDQNSSAALRSYMQRTAGLFVQSTWNVSEKLSLESGLRADHHNEYGFFILPRISLLCKFDSHFSSRVGGGLGYKAPTIFTEDAERIEFRNLLPIDPAVTKAERSYGMSGDVTYRTRILDGLLGISINQLLFYTRITSPILLTPTTTGNFQYIQPIGALDTKGLETNVRLTFEHLKLFLGYTLADVHRHENGVTLPYPLVSKHRLNNVLMYEVEHSFKVGIEAYYYSSQLLNDGSIGRGYWLTGLMAEKTLSKVSLFINGENLTDTRQTRFGAIYTGSITNPIFKDIYAPLEGIVINAGVRLKL